MTITILTIIDDIILLIGELVFVDFCKCLISVVSSYQVSQTEGVNDNMYVADFNSGNVSVIDSSNNTIE